MPPFSMTSFRYLQIVQMIFQRLAAVLPSAGFIIFAGVSFEGMHEASTTKYILSASSFDDASCVPR
uniref:Uncharacterized protein n=1 Tax=Arundo donax TaxID=35708 RepID=A0A0A9EAY1_ARUDO